MIVTLGYPGIKDPFAKSRVGADWAWHLAHGSTGGTDYVDNADVTVPAPCSGTVAYVTDRFNTIRITHESGWVLEFEECKKRSAKPGHIITGAALFVAGLDRDGMVRWPHAHGFDPARPTTRVLYSTAVKAIAAWEKKRLAQLTAAAKKAQQARLNSTANVIDGAKYLDAMPKYKNAPSRAALAGKPGAKFWARVQREYKAAGFPITVTGLKGPKTLLALDYFAQKQRAKK